MYSGVFHTKGGRNPDRKTSKGKRRASTPRNPSLEQSIRNHKETNMNHFVKLSLALLTAATLFTSAAPAAAAESGVVNVNTAGAAELSLLPRVGPALAAKILDHREENGPFKKVEDLLLVSGIGDKMFSLLEPFVRTSGETTLKEKIKAGSLAKPAGGKAKGDAPAKAGDGKEKATPAAEGAAEEGR